MNLSIGIGEGKSAQVSEDGSLSIYQGSNSVFLKPNEAQKLKTWIMNGVI